MATENTSEFLAGCELDPFSDEGKKAIKCRELLAEFTSPPRSPNDISFEDKVESNLNLHHVDSLDLVDFTMSIEDILGKGLGDTQVQSIREAQKSDCSVKEFFNLILNGSAT